MGLEGGSLGLRGVAEVRRLAAGPRPFATDPPPRAAGCCLAIAFKLRRVPVPVKTFLPRGFSWAYELLLYDVVYVQYSTVSSMYTKNNGEEVWELGHVVANNHVDVKK